MLKRSTILFFLFCTLSVFSQHSRQSDSLALVRLYQATNGSNWKNNQNWLKTPIDKWFGVTLQPGSGRVLKLHLYNNNLTGQLPDELITLDSVRSLVLSDNELNGNIPLLNELPWYKKYSKALSSLPISERFWYQDFVLTGNKYEFSDAEKDTTIYNRSFLYDVLPTDAYTNVFISKPFGTASEKRLAQGASFTFSFPYKTSQEVLEFQWTVETKLKNDLIAVTNQPTYNLSAFDSTKHSGTWICTIKRKNEKGSASPVRQNSYPIKLAGLINSPPKLLLGTILLSGNKEIIDSSQKKELPKEFSDFSLTGRDDLSPEKIKYSIVHAPANLQILINFTQLTNFSGSESYTISARRKTKDWIGKDSLVIKGVDEEGSLAYSVYYFESEKDISAIPLPFIDIFGFTSKTTPSGTWIYFKNARNIDQISAEISTFEENDLDCGFKTSQTTFLQPVPFSDSLFISSIKKIPNKDISYDIYFTAENSKGQIQEPFGLTLFERTPGNIPAGNIKFVVDTANQNITITGLKPFGSCGSTYNLFSKEQDSVSFRYLETGTQYAALYPLKPGIPYSFVASVSGRFSTDTFYVTLPRNAATTPMITANLNWEITCEKRIRKTGFIKNGYAPLKFEIPSTAHFLIKDEGDYFSISPQGQSFNGNEKIPLKITDNSGYIIDTFAMASFGTNNGRVKFSVDTARIAIKSTWTPINLLAYVTDAETPDSLMNLMIVRTGNIKFRTSNFKTEIMPAKGLVGMDTISVFVKDEGCATALMSFIISYDTLGLNNKAPYFEDPFWLNNEIYANTIDKYQRNYFYAEDTTSFPLNLDLRHYTRDDQSFEDLKFEIYEVYNTGEPLSSGNTLNQGLDIVIKDGFLSIKPKPNTFYGYPYVEDNYEFTSSFWLKLTVKDPFGAADTTKGFNINITNKPASGTSLFFQKEYTVCPKDTFSIDVRKVLGEIHPGKIIAPFIIYPNSSIHTMSYDVNVDIVMLRQITNIFKPDVSALKIIIQYQLPFYNTLHRPQDAIEIIDNITIKQVPFCDEPPVFSVIPVQKLSNAQSSTINLWNYVKDEQAAKDLFWTFERGKYINYTFNYETGILNSIIKNSVWKGLDTLIVIAEDKNYNKSRTLILFNSSQSPLIYPVPSNISVIRGAAIPSVPLLDKVTDDQTASIDIKWTVTVGPNIQATLINSTIMLTSSDPNWTGTEKITLIATDEEGLMDTATFLVEIKFPNGLSENSAGCNNDFFPNPVSEILTIASCEDSGEITLINSFGEVLLKQPLTPEDFQYLNVSQINPGVYFICTGHSDSSTGKMRKLVIY